MHHYLVLNKDISYAMNTEMEMRMEIKKFRVLASNKENHNNIVRPAETNSVIQTSNGLCDEYLTNVTFLETFPFAIINVSYIHCVFVEWYKNSSRSTNPEFSLFLLNGDSYDLRVLNTNNDYDDVSCDDQKSRKIEITMSINNIKNNENSNIQDGDSDFDHYENVNLTDNERNNNIEWSTWTATTNSNANTNTNTIDDNSSVLIPKCVFMKVSHSNHTTGDGKWSTSSDYCVTSSFNYSSNSVTCICNGIGHYSNEIMAYNPSVEYTQENKREFPWIGLGLLCGIWFIVSIVIIIHKKCKYMKRGRKTIDVPIICSTIYLKNVHKQKVWSVSKEAITHKLVLNADGNHCAKQTLLLWIHFLKNNGLILPLCCGLRDFGSNHTPKQRIINFFFLILSVLVASAIVVVIESDNANDYDECVVGFTIGNNSILSNEHICIHWIQFFSCLPVLLLLSMIHCGIGFLFQRTIPTIELNESNVKQLYVLFYSYFFAPFCFFFFFFLTF